MIRLRKLEPSDLPFLYQWENDASSWSEADTHNPLSQQDLRDYIQSTTGDIYRDGQLRLMVEDAESSETVGVMDLFDLDVRNQRAAIGMYLSPSSRGQGLGKQAIQELERYAFGFLHLRMLYAIIGVHNRACSTLYQQLEYEPTARLKEWTLEGDAIIWQKFSKKEG